MFRQVTITLSLLFTFFVPASSALADATLFVRGEAGIVDGDTLRLPNAIASQNGQEKTLKNVRIRLHGIDAPEKSQTCLDSEGNIWPCGRAALLAVTDMIGGREVTCEVKDIDRYQRLVAVCRTGSAGDINASLVRQGLAFAYRQYSKDYIPDEETAKTTGAGMWAGEFDYPWDFRKKR